MAALHKFVDEYKEGDCEWCGNHGTVFADNGRCEQCDSDIFRCSICKDDQHVDDLCRHIFQDTNLEWCGSGVGIPTKKVKQSFLALLGLMPDGFAADLRKAIRSGRFHTWLVAPLIGSGGCLSLYGMPNRGDQFMVHKWGDDLINIGSGDRAEEMADGYHWLVSLYDRKTPKANQLTISWINGWIKSHSHAVSLV